MIISLKNKIKQNKGFTGMDLSISVIVILISIAIIATMIYNLYLSGAGMKRNVIATDYAINILENIQATDYASVTFNQEESTTLKTKLDEMLKVTGSCDNNTNTYNANVNSYDITIKIEKYSDKFNTGEKEDYIKIITVKIQYNLGKNNADKSVNTENLEISTLKTIN